MWHRDIKANHYPQAWDKSLDESGAIVSTYDDDGSEDRLGRRADQRYSIDEEPERDTVGCMCVML